MLKKIVTGLVLYGSLLFGADLSCEENIKTIYKDLGIENKLEYSTFLKAIQGYNRIEDKKLVILQ